MHNQPISPLRQRVLDDMAARNFSDKTRHDYIRHIKSVASFLGRSLDTEMPMICGVFNCIKGRTAV
jgi:hypothetical protein